MPLKSGIIPLDPQKRHMDAEAFGRWLANARKERKLSQAVLGERVGVTKGRISQWENAVPSSDGPSYPPLDKFIALTHHLGRDVREPLKALGVLTEGKDGLTADEQAAVSTLRGMSMEGRRAALDVLKILHKLEGGTARPVKRPKRPASGQEEEQEAG